MKRPKLPSVTYYDEGTSTWEKTLAIAGFVATNIPHAFNCRLHSIMLFELLSAAGIPLSGKRFCVFLCIFVLKSHTICHVKQIRFLLSV